MVWFGLLAREFGFFFRWEVGCGFTEKADKSSHHNQKGNPENVVEEETAEDTDDTSNDASNDKLFISCPGQTGASIVDLMVGCI